MKIEEGLPQSMDIETLAEMAEFIQEHGKLGATLIEHFCGHVKDAQTAIEENYHGEHYSQAEFACFLMEGLDQRPDHLEIYMDYESLTRDLFINGYFSIDLEHKVHMFSCF